jgi:hypothetical protein
MPGNPVQTMTGKLQGRVTPQTQKAIAGRPGGRLHPAAPQGRILTRELEG